MFLECRVRQGILDKMKALSKKKNDQAKKYFDYFSL